MTFRLPRLQRTVRITENDYPTDNHQRWWQRVVEQIEAQFTTQEETNEELEQTIADLTATQAELATAQAELTAAQADIAQAQADITGVQSDLTGYVLKDQTAAWADASGTLARTTFASHAGQAVSAGYVQAEAQATDDAVKAVSQRLAALINDLRAANVLT